MLDQLEIFVRKLRRRLNRAEWAVRLLRLRRVSEKELSPGLILIQIDGLAHPQFLQALKEGRLPFLQNLMRRQGYTVRSLYSGLPSATPGVQGEL